MSYPQSTIAEVLSLQKEFEGISKLIGDSVARVSNKAMGAIIDEQQKSAINYTLVIPQSNEAIELGGGKLWFAGFVFVENSQIQWGDTNITLPLHAQIVESLTEHFKGCISLTGDNLTEISLAERLAAKRLVQTEALTHTIIVPDSTMGVECGHGSGIWHPVLISSNQL
ncbi:hypothetical protein BCT01_00710 [Vibrio tasmaniensis]|nr:hypothetical protein [Vibrio tasmaniensis]PMO89835.1 hypothetical protein BCT01_00710 [Vibrio tasmaniensis]PMP09992.1 hypothetical protein BCS92_02380 [Vibrio tasmaniensis]TKG59207.1 hypothetical protein FC072_20350 [Vibrio tasmaniensis]TKG62523.1 hypothetical protein FC066_12490 [Vibrio tasmaniensis]